jgi:hypothetical protein
MELEGISNEVAEKRMQEYEKAGLSVSDFYHMIQSKIGNRILVDKTPGYSSQLQILERAEVLFDDPLYIHLLRHPCGMIQSFLDYKMDQTYTVRYNIKQKTPYSPRQIGELVWTVIQRNIAMFLKNIPDDRQYRLRFEDLVRNPERELSELCGFVGIDYYDAMANPYSNLQERMTDAVKTEGRMQGDQNLLVKHRKVDPSVADRWMQVMSSDYLGEPARRMAAEYGYSQLQDATTLTSSSEKPLPILEESELVMNSIDQLNGLSEDEVDAMLNELLSEQEAKND